MINNLRSNPKKKPSLAAGLAILALVLVSCNMPGRLAAATNPPLSIPTLPAPLDTATPAPAPATATVTNSPLPTPTGTPAPVSIVFTTGTTAAVEQGSIQPNQVQAYTISAGENQPMILLLNSQRNDVYMGVTEANGNVLLDPAKKWTAWQWLLPKTELYTIQVYGGLSTQDYTLTVKVAQRINFAAGATSATLKGSTPKGFVFTYTIACAANQTMTVSLNVPPSTAYLDVFGLASGKLLSSSSKVNTWTGTLPATQDYIIEVIPNNGQVVNYTLTVSVH